MTRGTVIMCQPRRTFSLTWADIDWRATTDVMVMLGRNEQITELTLVHSGWMAFRGENGAAIRDRHAVGWNRHLDALVALSDSAAV